MKCQLGQTTVHYEQVGEGTPILFLHGFGDSHHSMMAWFEPVFQERDGWRRIYVDMPGHGYTPGHVSIRTANDVLVLLMAFVDKVLPGERFALGAFSFGGFIARALLNRRPEDVSGMLLVCPAVDVSRSKYPAPEKVALVRDSEWFERLSEEEAALAERWLVRQDEQTLRRYQQEVRAHKELLDVEFLTAFQPSRYTLSFDVDELAEQFAQPVAILAGRQDWIVGYQGAYELLKNYPRATFSTLDVAGHFLPIEQPKPFQATVQDWLERMRRTS